MSTVSRGIVLVADDSADDLFLLSRAFGVSKLDYSLATVEDGEQAITFLTREPCPALLLLDLKMPKVNGFEVLEWIQSKDYLRDLPVVVLSSSDLDVDKKRAKELGAKDYLVKPECQEKLLKAIAYLNTRFLVGHHSALAQEPIASAV